MSDRLLASVIELGKTLREGKRVEPALRGEIHVMAQYLAERERETHFRLKRFKGYKEAEC